MPFHHIFYTGGSRVGKIVMKAAANHLASVTLELGGKSPAILDEAVKNGASVVTGGITDDNENYIAPTLLDNVNTDHAIMKEEIFGPVLPVMTYQNLDDAIAFVNQGERPLALYVFGQDKKATQQVINETTAGGSVVNHVIMHYFSPLLPFGGVGNSGTGRGNGHFGFLDFSNQRPVFEL